MKFCLWKWREEI